MAWARLKNGQITNTKDSSKLDTSRQTIKRKTKNNLAKTIENELKSLDLTWGEAEARAQNIADILC